MYIHPDHLGGTAALTNASSTEAQAIDYFPFGEIRVNDQTDLFDEQRKFTGHEYDGDTNLTYANARYLSQDVGKWISQDPAALYNPGQFLADPQQFNSYSYGRNNPLILVDRDGRKVELVARPVISSRDAHLFYHVTPDNPGAISINGIPAGTESFTIGAYNRGGFLGIGNKLTPEFGYEGGPVNTDTPYLLGESSATSRTTISAPKGVSDSQLINSLGAAANGTGKISYFSLGQTGRIGNANSNNYVYDIGSQSGIGNQVSSFNPSGVFIPGKNSGLPSSTFRQQIQSSINNVRQKVSDLKESISSL